MGSEATGTEQGLELGGLGFFQDGSKGEADFRARSTTSADQVSLGPSAVLSSEYLRRRYRQAYEQPIRISQPRPRTTPTVAAPGEASNSVGAYYRKKFAAFYEADAADWKTVAGGPTMTPLKEAITGTTHITIEDLLMLIQVVAAEKERVQNLRSANPDTIVKVHDMDVLLGDLRTLSGKLDRRELREYQIPIRASVARNFLATFRSAVALPPLIDSVTLPPTQRIATLPQAPPPPPSPAKRGPDIVLLFQDVQQTRWELEASMDPRVGHYEDMLARLAAMERRIVSYATSDTPMPADLQMEFEEELRRLRSIFGKAAGVKESEAE